MPRCMPGAGPPRAASAPLVNVAGEGRAGGRSRGEGGAGAEAETETESGGGERAEHLGPAARTRHTRDLLRFRFFSGGTRAEGGGPGAPRTLAPAQHRLYCLPTAGAYHPRSGILRKARAELRDSGKPGPDRPIRAPGWRRAIHGGSGPRKNSERRG